MFSIFFMCLFNICISLFKKVSIQIFCSFKKIIGLSSYDWVGRVFRMFYRIQKEYVLYMLSQFLYLVCHRRYEEVN